MLLYFISKEFVSGKYLAWMLETNSPDWTSLRRLHRHTIDFPTGLRESTERFETLSGLDGDPAPHGRMLAALREPRLTRSQTDLGWSRMEDSLASLPHRSLWDSEVFIVPSALAITLEMGRKGIWESSWRWTLHKSCELYIGGCRKSLGVFRMEYTYSAQCFPPFFPK